jgi:hypothetical protein
MIRALVFHVVGTSKTILMARLFLVARGTRVPIFHIKTAGVAHILIGICFDDVGETRVTLRWIDSRGDVRDVGPHIRIGRRHRGSMTPATACAARMSTMTASSAATIAVMRVVGLLLEPMEWGRGIDLGRQGHIHIVACCGGIRCEHGHLLHQRLLLLMEPRIVSGMLLEGSIDLHCVGFEGCCHLCGQVCHVGVDGRGDGFGSVIIQDVVICRIVGKVGKAVARRLTPLTCCHVSGSKATLICLLDEQA